MNTFNIKTAVIAVALAFSAGALAEGISKTDYKAGQSRISVVYKAARDACSSFSDNTFDICDAKAKGNERVAKAELEASYKPTTKNLYDVSVARAEADYSVASQICDDRSGNTKDVCMKEAKAARTSAKADAMAQMKTAVANDAADEKTVEARNKAGDEAAAARKEATAVKLDADYTVAKEKCDTYADDAKDVCLDRAKIRFGKS